MGAADLTFTVERVSRVIEAGGRYPGIPGRPPTTQSQFTGIIRAGQGRDGALSLPGRELPCRRRTASVYQSLRRRTVPPPTLKMPNLDTETTTGVHPFRGGAPLSRGWPRGGRSSAATLTLCRVPPPSCQVPRRIRPGTRTNRTLGRSSIGTPDPSCPRHRTRGRGRHPVRPRGRCPGQTSPCRVRRRADG